MHRGPARSTDQEALLARDAARGEERVGIAHHDRAVHEGGVVGGGPEVFADAFDEVRPSAATRVHRSLGVRTDDLHVRVHPLEVASDPGDGAAGADAGDEVRDAAAGLAPNLGTGRAFVFGRIVRVRILVRAERIRRLARQAIGHGVVAGRIIGRHGRRAHDHLRAVGTKERHLLRTHLVGHDKNALIPALRGHDRETYPGIPRSGLHDRAAGLEEPVPLGRVDHRYRRPILDAASRIESLDLGDEITLQVTAEATHAHHRRVAHQVQQ